MSRYFTRSAAAAEAAKHKPDDRGDWQRDIEQIQILPSQPMEPAPSSSVEEEEEDVGKDSGENVFDVYYDPRAPGSLGGVEGLTRALKGVKTREQIREWLSSQPTYSLHKPVRKRFKRNVVLVHGIDEEFQADLCDVSMLAERNDGVNFLLTCIDVLSKYAWAIPLRNKSALSTLAGFEEIFSERKPVKLQTDSGKEFENSTVRGFMVRVNVHHFFAYNPDIKCPVVERFNRTLKSRLWRYLTYKKSFRYIDVLQDIVHSYNNTHHTTVKMTPVEASKPENEKRTWQNAYGHTSVARYRPASRITFKYKLGDHVRISEERDVFRKGYKQGWSKEVYRVVKQSPRDPVVYRLQALDGEPVIGSFYEVELQRVPKPQRWEIEEVVNSRKKGPKIEYFVKFKNYPDYQWLPASDIVEEEVEIKDKQQQQ